MKIPIRERRERGVCTRGHEGYVLVYRKETPDAPWSSVVVTRHGPNVGMRTNRKGDFVPYCLQCHREQMAARDKLSKEKRDELTRASEAVVGATGTQHPA